MVLNKLIKFYVLDYVDSKILDFKIVDLTSGNIQILSKSTDKYKNTTKRYMALGINVNVKQVKEDVMLESNNLIQVEYVMTKEINGKYYSLFEIIDMFGIIKNINETTIAER